MVLEFGYDSFVNETKAILNKTDFHLAIAVAVCTNSGLMVGLTDGMDDRWLVNY